MDTTEKPNEDANSNDNVTSSIVNVNLVTKLKPEKLDKSTNELITHESSQLEVPSFEVKSEPGTTEAGVVSGDESSDTEVLSEDSKTDTDNESFMNRLDLRVQGKSPSKKQSVKVSNSEKSLHIVETGLLMKVETWTDDLHISQRSHSEPEPDRDRVAVAKSRNLSSSSSVGGGSQGPSTSMLDVGQVTVKLETNDSTDDESESGKAKHDQEAMDTVSAESDDDVYIKRTGKKEEDDDDGSDKLELPATTVPSPSLHIVEGSLRRSPRAAPQPKVDFTKLKDQKKDLSCHIPDCKETFKKQCELINHERTHSGLPPLKCKYCKTGADHDDPPPIEVHLCQYCGKAFPHIRRLREHVKRHTDTRRYECDLCGKSFKNRTTLTRHNRIHTGERPYECMFCAKDFRDHTSWKKHELIHTGERPFKCEHCGKAFRQSQNLKAHVNSAHTAAQKWTCEICGKVTLRKDCLYTHMLTHQPKSKERPFKCEHPGCEKTFRTKDLLRTHKVIHTGIKKFKCNYCDKCFAKSGQRTIHHRTHTNERPFKCDYHDCDKSFRTKIQKDQHINTHTGDRPFKCSYCDKSFAARSTVRNHEKMHKREIFENDSLKGLTLKTAEVGKDAKFHEGSGTGKMSASPLSVSEKQPESAGTVPGVVSGIPSSVPVSVNEKPPESSGAGVTPGTSSNEKHPVTMETGVVSGIPLSVPLSVNENQG